MKKRFAIFILQNVNIPTGVGVIDGAAGNTGMYLSGTHSVLMTMVEDNILTEETAEAKVEKLCKTLASKKAAIQCKLDKASHTVSNPELHILYDMKGYSVVPYYV